MKTHIKNTARDLILQYGVRSVSMDDIATAIGSSKKTLYHHFSDKDSLISEVVEEMLDRNCECFDKDREQSNNAVQEALMAMEGSAEMFKSINPSIVYDLHKYHPLAYQKFAKFKNQFLFEMVKNNILRGIEEGYYRSELDIEVLAKFRVNSIFIPFNPDFYKGLSKDLSEVQRELFYHFLFGIATPAGYKLITKYQLKIKE